MERNCKLTDHIKTSTKEALLVALAAGLGAWLLTILC